MKRRIGFSLAHTHGGDKWHEHFGDDVAHTHAADLDADQYRNALSVLVDSAYGPFFDKHLAEARDLLGRDA